MSKNYERFDCTRQPTPLPFKNVITTHLGTRNLIKKSKKFFFVVAIDLSLIMIVMLFFAAAQL